ncbi:MAG: hypothetical protein SFY69_02280 [Planctomycetota bacterium]|nr:hypothetical protein [Planctomycetota bacterium]
MSTLARHRGAFALPLALLLVVVCTTMLAVMLQRHGADQRTAQRQIDAYAFGHATRGLSEALNLLAQRKQGTIGQALDRDGKLADLRVAGGEVLSIYLEDGQGPALSNLSGLGQENFTLGRDLLRRLVEASPEDATRMTREEGPLSVSVNTAPEAVLQAALGAITGGGAASGLAGDIAARRRAEGFIDEEGLRNLISGSELSDEQKQRAHALLTATPTLWRVRAVLDSGRVRAQPVEYRAWAIFVRARAGGDRANMVQRSVAIFGWERVAEVPYPDEMPMGDAP